jgi:hypothetical protein
MPKISWNDLHARDGGTHVIVAKLPDKSDEETLRNGRAPQQLLERLFRKLPIRGRLSGFEANWSASDTVCLPRCR